MEQVHQSGDFAAAIKSAEKAWYGTPMLARVRLTKGEQLRNIVQAGTSAEWAAYLSDVAGPAFASYSVIHGLDGQKAERLGRMVLEMAWAEIPQTEPSGVAAGVHRLELLSQKLQQWIATGEGEPGGDLGKAGALLSRPEPRLALLAPVASALGVCMVMLRAMAAGYPVGASA